MPPALTPFTLAAALNAIGTAEVYTGDPLLVPGDPGAMESLGATEGTIEFNPAFETNPLTAPELTGGVVHQSSTTLGNVTITVPVILGDASLYTRINPAGVASGGFTSPQKVQELGVLLIPRAEVGGGLSYNATHTPPQWERIAGNGVDAATGTDAAPKFAVWFWRAFVMHAALPYAYGNGGKVITTVTFTAMFDGSKPEGHKVYTIGDPWAAQNEITHVDAPIEVLPQA